MEADIGYSLFFFKLVVYLWARPFEDLKFCSDSTQLTLPSKILMINTSQNNSSNKTQNLKRARKYSKTDRDRRAWSMFGHYK